MIAKRNKNIRSSNNKKSYSRSTEERKNNEAGDLLPLSPYLMHPFSMYKTSHKKKKERDEPFSFFFSYSFVRRRRLVSNNINIE
jgi:hypothetical protein